MPKVVYHDQGGLLDVEIDPDFVQNATLYLSYAEAAEQQPRAAREPPDPRLGSSLDQQDHVLKGAAVARAKLVGDAVRDVTVIWRQVPKTLGLGHFGGRLVFAPDGKLFITSGERQRFEPAQDPGSNLGRVVRINSDGSIPDDHPFAKQPGARPDTWTLGHRNPLGAAINPASKQLWFVEMGPAHGDEVRAHRPQAAHPRRGPGPRRQRDGAQRRRCRRAVASDAGAIDPRSKSGVVRLATARPSACPLHHRGRGGAP